MNRQQQTGLNRSTGLKGFTLIELVMVILLLSILGAIAIPNFIDFRSDAKNAATQGALGALRSAISVATAAIQLKEDSGVPTYPTAAEMQANAYTSVHPVLDGTAIMDAASGIPKNPWTISTLAAAAFTTIIDCTGTAKGGVLATPNDHRGWCYLPASGQFWANSSKNGGGAGKTENGY